MMHIPGLEGIPRVHLYLLTTLLVFYGIYEVYHLEVDPQEFAVTHRRRIDASPPSSFDFLRQTHILEKLLPFLSRIKEADFRVLAVGKFYRAFWRLPIVGEAGKIHLMVTDYHFPKFLALESTDQLIKLRVEIRLNVYQERTILNVTLLSRRTSALFHYTVGRGIKYHFGNELRSALSVVTEIHRTIQQQIAVSGVT